jgi:hypothetical protein
MFPGDPIQAWRPALPRAANLAGEALQKIGGQRWRQTGRTSVP